MLRTLLLAEDSLVALAIEGLAVDTQQVQVVKTVDTFPTREYEVALLLSQGDPELVILQGKNPEEALELGLLIRERSPAIGVVVVGPRLPETMEAHYKQS